MGFKEVVGNRRSIRYYSDRAIEMEKYRLYLKRQESLSVLQI
jgi:nitroreductase